MSGDLSSRRDRGQNLPALDLGHARHAVRAPVGGAALDADVLRVGSVRVKDHDRVLLDTHLFAELSAHAVLRPHVSRDGEELAGSLRFHHLEAVERADVDAPFAAGAVLLADDGDGALLRLDLGLDHALFVLDAIDGAVARADAALDAGGRVDDVHLLGLGPHAHVAAPDAGDGALLGADRAADALVVDVIRHDYFLISYLMTLTGHPAAASMIFSDHSDHLSRPSS